MKYKYMHTINNIPARYLPNQQIYFICNSSKSKFIGKLVSSLKQIKEEQKKSFKWRKKQGFKVDNDYGHIRVEI
jgi:hypothetical protein